MNIQFERLTLHNFKAHRDLIVEFGDVTTISGDNGKGKTSIPEAIAWLLYGVDVLGNTKFDPTPTNYDFDFVKAELLLTVDDVHLLLGRGIEKGKNTFYVNEVPSSATEFNETVAKLFESKDLFLSLFNATYFPGRLHWEDQRKLLLSYVTAPASKEVFAEMSRTDPKQKIADIPLNPHAAKLAELTKKHSLDDLQKIHSKNKTDKDKAYIAAQSRTKTLRDQYNRLPSASVDLATVDADIAKLEERIAAMQSDAYANARADVEMLQHRYDMLLERIKGEKQRHATERGKQLDMDCPTCGQVLPPDQMDAIAEKHNEHCKAIAEGANELIADATALRDELAKKREAFAVIEPPDADALEQLHSAKAAIIQGKEQTKRRNELAQEFNQAEADEAATLQSRNESILILDAIKAYRAKEAELMAAKVQGMFTTLSIRLFERQKNGEDKPYFEIEMDDKPYRKLSTAEEMRAGLEVRDVLSDLCGIVAPCFLDNGESITRFKRPRGQLIVCRVVADQELKIETEGATNGRNDAEA